MHQTHKYYYQQQKKNKEFVTPFSMTEILICFPPVLYRGVHIHWMWLSIFHLDAYWSCKTAHISRGWRMNAACTGKKNSEIQLSRRDLALHSTSNPFIHSSSCTTEKQSHSLFTRAAEFVLMYKTNKQQWDRGCFLILHVSRLIIWSLSSHCSANACVLTVPNTHDSSAYW